MQGQAQLNAQLFAALTGADAGGTWSNIGLEYTYTLQGTGTCTAETDTSIVTVTEQDAPNAGIDGSMTICAGTSPTDAQLFAQLNGTPDTNGTWSNIGLEYTYTLQGTGTCTVETDTSIVTVIEQDAPNAGIDGSMTICAGTSPTDAQLFAQLNGTPDTNGTWSNIGLEYTYTLQGTGTCTVETDTSIVTVIEQDAPNAGIDGSMTICAGTSLTRRPTICGLNWSRYRNLVNHWRFLHVYSNRNWRMCIRNRHLNSDRNRTRYTECRNRWFNDYLCGDKPN